MSKEPVIRLAWRGQETIEAIPGLLNEAEQIEIALPSSYNHALFRALNPDAPASTLEDINVSTGPELLEDIATLNGLEELGALTSVLRRAKASVQILSPPMLVIKAPSMDV